MDQKIKKIISAAALLLLLAMGGLAWFYYLNRPTPAIQPSGLSKPGNRAVTPTSSALTDRQRLAASPEASTTPALMMDYDLDGLFDDMEKKVGTDPLKADTDTDGLDDYAETMVWLTDPFKPDTDGDGHPDGEEVRNNFNPKGAGALK